MARVEAACLVAFGPGRACQPTEAPGGLRRRRVGLLQARERLGHRLPGHLLGLGRGRQLPGRLLAPTLRAGQAGRGLLRRRPQLEQALRPRAAALRPA